MHPGPEQKYAADGARTSCAGGLDVTRRGRYFVVPGAHIASPAADNPSLNATAPAPFCAWNARFIPCRSPEKISANVQRPTPNALPHPHPASRLRGGRTMKRIARPYASPILLRYVAVSTHRTSRHVRISPNPRDRVGRLSTASGSHVDSIPARSFAFQATTHC